MGSPDRAGRQGKAPVGARPKDRIIMHARVGCIRFDRAIRILVLREPRLANAPPGLPGLRCDRAVKLGDAGRIIRPDVRCVKHDNIDRNQAA